MPHAARTSEACISVQQALTGGIRPRTSTRQAPTSEKRLRTYARQTSTVGKSPRTNAQQAPTVGRERSITILQHPTIGKRPRTTIRQAPTVGRSQSTAVLQAQAIGCGRSTSIRGLTATFRLSMTPNPTGLHGSLIRPYMIRAHTNTQNPSRRCFRYTETHGKSCRNYSHPNPFLMTAFQ